MCIRNVRFFLRAIEIKGTVVTFAFPFIVIWLKSRGLLNIIPPAMPHIARALPLQLLDLGFGIDEWHRAVEAVPEVVSVERMLNDDGTTRKSMVAFGTAHLCPWELYVYVIGRSKKDRVASGFSMNGNFLHVYFRTPGAHLSSSLACRVFAHACVNLCVAMEEAVEKTHRQPMLDTSIPPYQDKRLPSYQQQRGGLKKQRRSREQTQ